MAAIASSALRWSWLLVAALAVASMAEAARGVQRGGDETEGVSISVSYGMGEERVREGEEMRVSETGLAPKLYVEGKGRSYAVAMIDTRASRGSGGPLSTYVHYWVVVTPQGKENAATIDRVVAPYVRPQPHDSLLHPYQFFVLDVTPLTSSAPPSFLFDRFTPDFFALVGHPAILASTSFIEQL